MRCLRFLQSVFWSQLACTSIFNLVPEYTHYVQLKQTTLGRGQRGRSSRGRDGSGDQPILQGNETGLICGTSVRDSKKNEQNQENVPRTFCDELLSANLTTTCPPWSNKKTDTAADKTTIFTKCSRFYIDL